MSKTLMGFLIRRHRLTTILFGLLPFLIGLVVGLLYPTYSKERQLMRLLKYTSRFFGGEKLDLFSPDGAFSMPFQHPLVLIAYAIVPAIAALATPAGDRGTKCIDMMLATPLSRMKLIGTVRFYQLLASFYFALMTLLGASFSGVVAGEYSHIDQVGFMSLSIIGFLLMAVFGSISMLVSVMARDRGQATLVYGTLVTVFFLIDVTARMWKDGSWLAWLTPYGYLRPSRILSADNAWGRAWLEDVSILLVLAVFGQIIAAGLYRRRRSV